MNFPATLRYTKDHEWVSLEGNIATVGITDFAQDALGDVVFVDIDTIGRDLKAEDIFGTVDSVKSVSDLFLPLSGKVLEINPLINKNPDLVNSDPYGDGWMVKVEVTNPADFETLMDAEAYKNLVA